MVQHFTMKGNDDVIALLGELLANELTAVNQYLLHAKTCENWGYHRLAERLRADADEEAGDRDKLVDRILFLEGVPDLQKYHPIRGGKTVKEMLELDLELERKAITDYRDGIAKSRECGDNATEDLLTKILVSEEEDAHWLEAQLELIRQVGEQNYLASQIKG